MSNCTFIENPKPKETECNFGSRPCRTDGIVCTQSGLCTLRTSCRITETVTLNRRQLSSNVLCTNKNVLEFSCLNERPLFCVMGGHVGFEVQDPSDCETLVSQERYNWDHMMCSCSTCTKNIICSTLLCSCSVRTFPQLSTSSRWQATTQTTYDNFSNTVGYQPASVGHLTTQGVYPTQSPGQNVQTGVNIPAMVIGIVAGGVVICLLIFAIVFIYRKRTDSRKENNTYVNDCPQPAAGTALYEVPVNSQSEGHVYTALANYQEVTPVYDNCESQGHYYNT